MDGAVRLRRRAGRRAQDVPDWKLGSSRAKFCLPALLFISCLSTLTHEVRRKAESDLNRLPERAPCQNGRENADALSLRRGDNAKIHTAVQGTGVSSAEKSRENEENPAFHEKSKKQVHRKQRKAREFSVQRKWALSKRMRRKAPFSLSFSASWRAIVAYQRKKALVCPRACGEIA